MSYALDFADEAVEDLERLLDSLPQERRARALDAIEVELLAFAGRPLPRLMPGRPRPYTNIYFQVDNVGYRWGATYVISQDEKRVVITHLYRIAL